MLGFVSSQVPDLQPGVGEGKEVVLKETDPLLAKLLSTAFLPAGLESIGVTVLITHIYVVFYCGARCYRLHFQYINPFNSND